MHVPKIKTHAKAKNTYSGKHSNSHEAAAEAWPFPAVGFYYTVKVFGSDGVQAAFQEVSGMEVASEVETVHEAGLNQYSHRLPKRTQYNNLVLKRGLWVETDSKMKNWVIHTLQDGLLDFVHPRDILVTLLNEKNEKVMAWNFIRAYPVKWSASGLNSMQSAVVIEQIEFAYSQWKFA